MAISSKDIETLWGHYQSEGVSKGVSVSQYFEANGIPYHVFEKWYKKRFRQPDVVDCVVDGVPDDAKGSCASSPSDYKSPIQVQAQKISVIVSHVNICLSNGMRIDHHKLSYAELLSFIQKLEPLCLA